MMMEMEVEEMSAYKQQEMEEKNGWTPMFQAQYSTPKTSKRWKKKMDGPHVSGPIFNPKNQQEMEEKNGWTPCFRPNIQPQKPARDGREKWTSMVQA
jgi:hypothetical protein